MHPGSESYKPDEQLRLKWYSGKALDTQSGEPSSWPNSLSMACLVNLDLILSNRVSSTIK